MFHLCKQTRFYNGNPYSGPTSNNAPAEFTSFEEAKIAQELYNVKNPVGWNIYNAETRKLVDGFDFYKS